MLTMTWQALRVQSLMFRARYAPYLFLRLQSLYEAIFGDFGRFC